MAKSIHQRVRAAIEKREREERQQQQREQDAKMRKAQRTDLARENRIEALISGRANPRTLEEMGIVMRAEGWEE